MKKLFLVLAIVAVYGVSMAMSGSNVVIVDNFQTTLVTDVSDNNTTPATEKEKEKTKEVKAVKTDAKSEGCGTAKSEGCGGEKSAAKSGCCADKAKSASTEKK
jgi:hypothetical protein